MEHLGVVDEEELKRVCSERETILDRPLHPWEREALHLHLRNESLKAVSREERLLTPGFDKVICSSFGSYLLDLLIVKEIKAVRNRFDVLKRRPDFDETILPPRKVARSKRSVRTPCGSRHVFLIMEVSWDPVWVTSRSFRVFHGFWLVSMVFHGSMLVFQGFSPECTRPKLYPGPTIQSRSAARRAA